MRIGLLVDGPLLKTWAADSVAQMLSETDTRITLIVENEQARDVHWYLETMRDEGAWTLQAAIWMFQRRFDRHPSYRKPVPIRELIDGDEVTWLNCQKTEVLGTEYAFPDRIVTQVAERTDVLIRFGFGIIKGDILTAPEKGVLSFHHGNIRKFRGRPPGFWEFLSNADSTGVTLMKLDETLDGGGIVTDRTLDISDCYTWQEVKNQLYPACRPMLHEAIERLSDCSFSPEHVDDLGVLRTRPNAVQMARYILKKHDWGNQTLR